MSRTGGTADVSPHRWLSLAVLNLAVLLVAIDGTVLNLAIPQITTALDASATQVLWILDVYSLVLAGLLVSAGALSDRLGRKRVLLAGCALFGVASTVAAFSTSAEMLICARVFLAVGGATIMPSTLALIRTLFADARERTLAIGIWSAMAAAGAAIGPILGGLVLERAWWGAVFLINVPVMVVLLVAGGLLLPEFRTPAPGRWDFASAAASIFGLVALVYTLKGIAEHGVNASTVLTGLGAAGALWWFVRRQRMLAEPLIDVDLFRQRPFTGAVLGNLFALLALSGLLLFVSQYLQLILGHSPLEAGLRLLPITLGAVVGAPLTARSTQRLGVRITVVTGLLVGALGMVGFALAVRQPYAVVAGSLFLVAMGVSMALAATSDAILSAAPPERAGGASAISETAYELGTGLGIALLGSVLGAVYAGALRAAVGPEVAGAHGSLAATMEAAGGLPVQEAAALLESATEAFLTGIRSTAYFSAGLLAIAAATTGGLLRGRLAAARGHHGV